VKMEIDSTIASVLIVIGVLGAGLFLEDIKTMALGAIALLVLLIAVKVIYFEFPVIIAMITLAIIALYGDELAGFISERRLKTEDIIDITEPSNEEERKFINEVKAAYAEQYAGNGQVITVDPDYAKKLFEAAGIVEEFKYEGKPDAYPIIFIGGVDKIEKIIISSDKPLPADGQVRELIKNRRIWVKVRIGDRDNIWVKVKAYVGKLPALSITKLVFFPTSYLIQKEIVERFDGTVWNLDISYFNSKPLYEEYSIDILSEPDKLTNSKGRIAEKIATKAHYWNYDIAEV